MIKYKELRLGWGFILMICILIGCANSSNVKSNEDKSSTTPFQEKVKDHILNTGFFDYYVNKNNPNDIKLVIRPEQFNKQYLCSVTRAEGDADFFDSSAMLYNFLFYFKKINNRIQMMQLNLNVRPGAKKYLKRAIDAGISESMFSSAMILCKPEEKTGNILISLNELMVKDFEFIAKSASNRTGANFTYDNNNSYIDLIKAYPENFDLKVKLHFRANNWTNASLLSDSRSFFASHFFSIIELPKSSYIPRFADERVGYFMTMFLDYSDMEKESLYVYYINRWDLKKADNSVPLSPPVKPVVFWLQNTIPEEYRPAIKRGILAWNLAFEKIGIKNAIVVKQQPEDADWESGDSRYNTICWMINPGATYAVGPSHTNPFTGEIYDADIRICADMIAFESLTYEDFVQRLVDDAKKHNSQSSCDYPQFKAMDSSFAFDCLSLDLIKGQSKENMKKKFINDFLTDLVMHEVGHTLGLRHNFKGSTAYSVAELENAEFTNLNGVTGSIMDYNPVNVIIDDEDYKGRFFQHKPGPYDMWAIQYGYSIYPETKTPNDEIDKLQKIAEHACENTLAYGTDEDAYNGYESFDPYCTRYDLSKTPLKFFKQRSALCLKLMQKVKDKCFEKGVKYDKFRKIWGRAFGQYLWSAKMTTKFIGGISFKRARVGDLNEGETPFEIVDPETQREALNFIKETILDFNFADLDPELVNMLVPAKMYKFKGRMQGRVKFHELLLANQKQVLGGLFNPQVLDNLVDMKLYCPNDLDYLSINELFEFMYKAIYGNISSIEKSNSFNRGLQSEYANLMINMLLSKPKVNREAESLSFNSLTKLLKELKSVLKGNAILLKSKGNVKGHYMELERKIEGAFDEYYKFK